MSEPIRWKCLGEDYLLIRGMNRRVVPSDSWWMSLAGAVPTQEELERIWLTALPSPDKDCTVPTLEWNMEVARELEAYIASAQSELEATREEAEAGQVTAHEVLRQEESLRAAREQLDTIEKELRRMFREEPGRLQ